MNNGNMILRISLRELEVAELFSSGSGSAAAGADGSHHVFTATSALGSWVQGRLHAQATF